jgi:hypothetical protein
LSSNGLPPEQDLAALIRQEHQRAELQRLQTGQDGCGCADCQAFYKTLGLSAYGDRVVNAAGAIVIKSGKAGAILVKDDRDSWSDCGQVNYISGSGWGLTSTLKSVCLGNQADIEKALKDGKVPGDATPIQRDAWKWILEYRRSEGYGSKAELFKPRNFIRSGDARAFKSRKATIRQNPKRKAPPVHRSINPGKDLSSV